MGSRAGLGYGVEVPETEVKQHCIAKYIDKGGNVETQRLYLARRTLLEMLKDRGYGVDDSDINISLAEFRTRFVHSLSQEDLLHRLRFSVSRVSNPSQKVPYISPVSSFSCGGSLTHYSGFFYLFLTLL